MKILLFLYPIEEYMQSIWKHRPEVYDLLNQTINDRYRQNGYQIIFVTFKNKPVFGVDVLNGDKVIETDITFDEHITPISKNENGEDIFRYPSNNYLQSLIGDFDKLVVCGFHAQDCVMRVADYFYQFKSSTLVDEELSDFLGVLSRRFYFKKNEYNLANRLLYDKAEDFIMYGKEFLVNMSHYKERFAKPYFHVEDFIADFTLEECMDKLIKMYEERQKEKNKNFNK